VDILLMPSLSEPFGRVTWEAMSLRVPVVVSRTSGVAEILRDGEDSLLVSPGSNQELAGAMQALIGDERLRQRLGANGYRTFLAHNDWPAFLDRFERVLCHVNGRQITRPTMEQRVPLVYITIANYNGKDDTSECLESIRRLEYHHYQTLVIDNGSQDGSVAHLRRQFPWAEVIASPENLGFGCAHNLGIRRALERGAEYILVLNNDTVVSPTLLSDLLEAVASDPSIGVAGPKVLWYRDPHRVWFAGGKLHMAFGSTRHVGAGSSSPLAFTRVVDQDYQTGCALLLRRDLAETIGVFDPHYFPLYWEDVDLCLRARAQGYRVVCVQRAVVWHKVSSTTRGGASPRKAYLKARSAVTFFRDHAPALRRYTTVPLGALACVLATALLSRSGSRWGLLMASVQGWRDGLKARPPLEQHPFRLLRERKFLHAVQRVFQEETVGGGHIRQQSEGEILDADEDQHSAEDERLDMARPSADREEVPVADEQAKGREQEEAAGDRKDV